MDHTQSYNFSEQLPDDFFGIIYGIRRSGKSTILKKILYDMKDRLSKHKVYLFSSTAKVDPEQYNYYPPDFKYSDIENLDDSLGELLEQQTQKLESKNEEMDKILIILDDCVNDNTIRHSPMLNSLAVSGRHLHFSVFILSQSVCGSASVPPIIRTNSDFIILATLPRSVNERNLILEQYMIGSHHCNRESAVKLLEKITAIKYRVVVIIMYETAARNYNDYVFKFGPFPKDTVPDDFKIGDKTQWSKSSKDEGKKNSSDEENEDKNINLKKIKKTVYVPHEDINGGDINYNKGKQPVHKKMEQFLSRPLTLQRKNYISLSPALDPNHKTQFRSFMDVYSLNKPKYTDYEVEENIGNNQRRIYSNTILAGYNKKQKIKRRRNKLAIPYD